MTLVQKGNEKLGKGVYTTSLEAGASCGGASDWCTIHCYAKAIQSRRPNVLASWGGNLQLLREDPGAYEATMRLELAKRKAGDVVRVHVSGDFDSLEHLRLWVRIARDLPELTFYAYTRSWNDPNIGPEAFDELRSLPNFHLWASTDETMPAAPGWREARIFEHESDAREAGYAVCPEQVGRKPSCSACGLCWKAGDKFKLAFVTHANLRPMAERHAKAAA